MKLSVSLPREDVDFLDSFAKEEGIKSRSAAVHRAVRLLRAFQLGSAYEEAWDEWFESGEEELWDQTTGDGIR